METPEGERLAAANSVWTLLDMEKMYPVRVPEEIIGKYELAPKLDMEYSPRKIAVPKEGGECREDIVVRMHHLDTNQHMNNAQYVHFAVMYLPADSEIRELRVEYRRQAVLGDRITPVIYRTHEDTYLVSMNGEDGKPYAVVEMKLYKNFRHLQLKRQCPLEFTSKARIRRRDAFCCPDPRCLRGYLREISWKYFSTRIPRTE